MMAKQGLAVWSFLLLLHAAVSADTTSLMFGASGSYTAISGSPLFSTCNGTIECFHEVSLPFSFGSLSQTSFSISSNGAIFSSSAVSVPPSSAIGAASGNGFRIAIFHAPLAPSMGGTVVHQCSTSSCVVSFQGVPTRLPNGTAGPAVSAQAELYASGDVEIRFGMGPASVPQTFACGVEVGAAGVSATASLPGCTDTTGLCGLGGIYPSQQGLRFSWSNQLAVNSAMSQARQSSLTDVRMEASRAVGVESALSAALRAQQSATVTLIASEASRASVQESSLAAAINPIVLADASRARVEGLVTASIAASVLAERTRALTSEVKLQGSIDEETSRAIVAEGALSASVSAVQGDIEGEASRALAVETALTGTLAGEITRALSVEASIALSAPTQLTLSSALATIRSSTLAITALQSQAASFSAVDRSMTISLNAASSRAIRVESSISSRLAVARSVAASATSLVQVALDGEIIRATDIDIVLEAGIQEIQVGVSGAVLSVDYLAAVSQLNAIDTELSQGIYDERIRAIQGEQDVVNLAIANQTQGGGVLGLLFASMAASMEREASRSAGVDKALNSQIVGEEVRARSKESALTTSLIVEISRAMAAEASIAAVTSNSVTVVIINQISQANSLRGDISRAVRVEESISLRLGREESRAKSAEASISRALADESSFARTASSDTNELIASETSRATSAENDLGLRIDLLSSQATSALQGFSDLELAIQMSLAASIDEERLRALGAEASLQSSLTMETIRATSSEASLAVISQVETSRATVAERSLSIRLFAANSRAIFVDASLGVALLAETVRASRAEDLLSLGISNEASRATSVEESLAIDARNLASLTASVDNSLALSIAEKNDRLSGVEVSLQSIIVVVDQGAGNGLASLAQGLRVEVSRAIRSENSLGWTLAGEVSRAKFVETSISNTLMVEISRSPAVDRSISLSILAEAQRAAVAEASIANVLNLVQDETQQERSIMRNVDIIEKDIIRLDASLSFNHFEQLAESEASRAMRVEASLASSVRIEVSRASIAEWNISSSVDRETSRAWRVESSIAIAASASAWSLRVATNTETSRASAVEASLALALPPQASFAAAVDASLAAALLEEALRAGSTESSLGVALSSAVDAAQIQNLAETSRASAVEASLAWSVRLEASIATARTVVAAASAGVYNQRAINAEASISAALTEEVSRATRIENGIAVSLGSEVFRATATDASLARAVVTETSRAVGAEVGLSGTIFGVEGSLAMIIAIEASRTAAGTGGVLLVVQSAAAKAAQDVAQEGGRAVAVEISLAFGLARDTSNAKNAQADLATSASAATSLWSSAVSSLGLALAGEVSRAVFVETVLSVLIANQSSTVAILTGAETMRAQSVEASLARAQAADAASEAVVDGSLAQSIVAVNSRLNNLSGDFLVSLPQEISRATFAETTIIVMVQNINQTVVVQGEDLSAAIANVSARVQLETQRAVGVEANLSAAIDINAVDISSVAMNLSIVQNVTFGLIADENVRAVIVEESLAQSLSTATQATRVLANSTTVLADNVSQLTVALAQETAARLLQDAALSTAVVAETQRASDAERSLALVASARDAEVNASLRAVNTRIDGTLYNLSLVENATLSRIAEERDRAVGAEASIGASVQNLNQSVVAQGASLSGAVASVSQRLLLETQRATDTESSLNVSIQGNTGSIMALALNLSTLENATLSLISQERNRAMLSESSLSTSFNSRVQAIQSAINASTLSLRANISMLEGDLLVEASQRAAQDAILDSTLQSETARAGSVEGSIASALRASEVSANTTNALINSRIDLTITSITVLGSETSLSIAALTDDITRTSSSLSAAIASEQSRAMNVETSIQIALFNTSTALMNAISIAAANASAASSLLRADLDAEVSARIAAAAQGSQLLSQEESRAMAAEADLLAQLMESEASTAAELAEFRNRLDVDEDFLARRPLVSGYWSIRDRTVPECTPCMSTSAVVCSLSSPANVLEQSFEFKLYQLFSTSSPWNATDNTTLSSPIASLEVRNGNPGCLAITAYTAQPSARRRSAPLPFTEALNTTSHSPDLLWTFRSNDQVSTPTGSATSSTSSSTPIALIIIIAINACVTLMVIIGLIILCRRRRVVETHAASKEMLSSSMGQASATTTFIPMGRGGVASTSTFTTAHKADMGQHVVENPIFAEDPSAGGVQWSGLGYLDVAPDGTKRATKLAPNPPDDDGNGTSTDDVVLPGAMAHAEGKATIGVAGYAAMYSHASATSGQARISQAPYARGQGHVATYGSSDGQSVYDTAEPSGPRQGEHAVYDTAGPGRPGRRGGDENVYESAGPGRRRSVGRRVTFPGDEEFDEPNFRDDDAELNLDSHDDVTYDVASRSHSASMSRRAHEPPQAAGDQVYEVGWRSTDSVSHQAHVPLSQAAAPLKASGEASREQVYDLAAPTKVPPKAPPRSDLASAPKASSKAGEQIYDLASPQRATQRTAPVIVAGRSADMYDSPNFRDANLVTADDDWPFEIES